MVVGAEVEVVVGVLVVVVGAEVEVVVGVLVVVVVDEVVVEVVVGVLVVVVVDEVVVETAMLHKALPRLPVGVPRPVTMSYALFNTGYGEFVPELYALLVMLYPKTAFVLVTGVIYELLGFAAKEYKDLFIKPTDTFLQTESESVSAIYAAHKGAAVLVPPYPIQEFP